MKTKFRGFSERLNKWVCGDLVDGNVIVNGIIEINNDDIVIERWEQVIPSSVGQYTGLKGYMGDKYDDYQEKSVYKGDIIDIFWEDFPAGYYRENHLVGVVDIDNTGTSWVLKNAKYESDVPKQIPSEIHGWSISLDELEEDELEEVFLHNFNLTSDDITILGNIYQNKELLEGE